MNIAVLMAGARFDTQRRVIEGILQANEEDEDVNIFLFTCDAWSYSSSQYNLGETNIFRLAELSSFDGVILHGDTICNQHIVNDVVTQIKESRVPCISLGVQYDGMAYLGMENESGISDIVDHLIQVHNAKHINFIAGPAGNADSIGRLKAFKEGLVRNGREVEDNRIYYGDYHPDSGKDAVVRFSSQKIPFPDAIMCANDEMALGVFYELEKRGVKVPEQVMITGYDYTFAGRHQYPKITSVKRPEKEMGRKAYLHIKEIIKGSYKPETELISKPVFTESCGCKDCVREDNRIFRKSFVKTKLHMTTYSEIIKSSAADFTGVGTFEQLKKNIRKYIYMIDPQAFYMCMSMANEEEQDEFLVDISGELDFQDIASYNERTSIPIVYEDGKFDSYGEFDTKRILPDECREREKGRFYTVIPMHFQERCFGYFVLADSKLMIDSELFHLFIMNINSAIENIRKQNMLNHMVDKLNRMWVYDTLTGIFNRAGFFKYAPAIIEEATRNQSKIFVLFLDLDGLKKVNDQYGHDEGDSFIKAMATVLSQIHQRGELLMRYGGDEFVVFSQGYTEKDAKEYVAKIRTGMENYNSSSEHPYTLDASIGYTLVMPDADFDLEDVIELADQEMYKEKNDKKSQKKAHQQS